MQAQGSGKEENLPQPLAGVNTGGTPERASCSIGRFSGYDNVNEFTHLAQMTICEVRTGDSGHFGRVGSTVEKPWYPTMLTLSECEVGQQLDCW